VAARDRLEVTVERVELTVQPVELDQHRAQRGVRELVVEAFGGRSTLGASWSTAIWPSW
jgi:hypothetical protein